MFKFITKLFDTNKKEIERLKEKVVLVNDQAKKVARIKDDEFASQTAKFKKKLTDGSTLDDLLPEALALVREASERAVGLRPFDVQLMAAVAFHEGKVAEQRTGEGKTLSAVPALYLNALTGRGAHLITVNDYLARRDAGWNGPTFHLLGMSVGVIIHDQAFIYDPKYSDTSHVDDRLAHLRPCSRREAYVCDITYGTNNEYGFDYLRDNMVSRPEEKVQRGHHFAVVDEVDSILIDEARTPLIISMPDTEPTQKYYEFAKLIQYLNSVGDFVIDEKFRTANLTDAGLKKVESLLHIDNLYEKDFDTIHHIENALKARTLFIRDKHYIVRDNQVVIVDEFTGRLMPGRRWSEGIHQAVEAKENVAIQQESKTLATISFQNYFRMYEKLAGMTGTASTEAEEFQKIYKLDVVVIPTHRDNARKDQPDVVYKNNHVKYNALVAEISKTHALGQPVLVGTTSIEKNEILSDLLKKHKIPHQLLNAKNHEKEAQIISEAGRFGAVTIATNIAGRGVDIVLGGAMPPNPKFVLGKEKLTAVQYAKAMKEWQKGHDEVTKAGGLKVIGTERHESRRIDNQLRGRSGRQGDPGETRFYLALDDEIMRVFGGDQVSKIMSFLKIPDDEPIEHSMVSRAIEQAQIKVEGFNFDARKDVVEYDDVMNKQRGIVYSLRDKVLAGSVQDDEIKKKIADQMNSLIEMYAPSGIIENEALSIVNGLCEIIPFDDTSRAGIEQQIKTLGVASEVTNLLNQIVNDTFMQRKIQVGDKDWNEVVKFSYLSSIDNLWIRHLDAMENLRSGVRLRGYGQKDPLVEYKQEAFGMFERLLTQIESEFSRRLFRIQTSNSRPQPQIKVTPVTPKSNDFMSAMQGLQKGGTQNTHKNLGRNDPCHCGSGKKYKKCHYPN